MKKWVLVSNRILLSKQRAAVDTQTASLFHTLWLRQHNTVLWSDFREADVKTTSFLLAKQ